MPHRGFLVGCLLAGVMLVCAGQVGPVDGILATPVRSLLDGALAPLRNVHKFDVVLRLPLALGLAHLAGHLSWGRTGSERHLSSALVIVLAAGAVVGMATPLLALQVAPNGSFNGIPDYWRQTASWLDQHNQDGLALLEPGSRFGQYVWGDPQDEPLQPLSDSRWDVRAAVPLSTAGHVRALDAVDAQLAAGRPSDGIAAFLQRSGVTYLVVRNDLDQSATQTPRPVVLHQALAESPGLYLVQSFGPPVGHDDTPLGTYDQHLQLPYQAVEIWAVPGSGDPRVSAAPSGSAVQVSGGPESVLTLSDRGLPAQTPTVLTGDLPSGTRLASTVLTDGLRRREVNFGAGPQNTSATLTLDDPRRLAGVDRDWLPFDGDQHQTYARYQGVAGLHASSSGSDADTLGPSVRSASPYAALDGDPDTAWTATPATRGVGEWLEVDFTSRREVDSATVRPSPKSTAIRVRVTTDAGVADTDIAGTAPIALNVVPGPTRSLRMTVTAVNGSGPFHPVAVTALSIPGLHVTRTMVMPTDLSTGSRVDQVEMAVTDDARPGCVLVSNRPLCAVGTAQLGEESSGLDRTFTLPASDTYELSVTAVPRAGAALDALLRAQIRPSIVATASSQAVTDPLAGPQTTVDGDLGTGWISSVTDPAPTLHLRWSGRRTIDGLTIITDPFLAASPPNQVVVTSLPERGPRRSKRTARCASRHCARTTSR